eukprot:TRINITY_DN1701_c0_g1_i1.p1 TRINITY_DN1701_c0_g1~~TRINITY_DN1701_c0_g1_i1.p1  ORF type:complete len:209 (-),score=23.49 TRINITY_DN1701_c0_g1_i1:265-867(-)
MIRRPPRSTHCISSAASDVYKRQVKSPITVDINQLNLVLDVLGSPTEEEIDSFPNTQTRNFLRSLEKKQPKPLESLFKNASPDAIDLLSKLLKFDQNKRITVEDALAHPYLKDLHYPADEVSSVVTVAHRSAGDDVRLCLREVLADDAGAEGADICGGGAVPLGEEAAGVRAIEEGTSARNPCPQRNRKAQNCTRLLLKA